MLNHKFNTKSTSIMLVCVSAIGGSLLANAQGPQKQPTTAPQKAPGAPPVSTPPPSREEGRDGLDAEEMTGGGPSRIYNMRDWVYTRNDMTVRGAAGVFDEKKDTLVTNTPIVLDDDKYHITADSALIEHVKSDRKLRTVTLTGHVILVLKPEKPKAAPVLTGAAAAPAANTAAPAAPPKTEEKSQTPDLKEDRKHGGMAYCDKLVYQSDGKRSSLTGHVIFKQSFEDDDGKSIDRKLTCDYAEHDGKKDILHLFKPVHYEDSKKQIMDTPNDVMVGTKEGEETISGTKVKFSFPTDKDDDEDSKGPAKSGGDTKNVPKPGQKTGK